MSQSQSLAIAIANSLEFADAIKLSAQKGTLAKFSDKQRAMLKDQMGRFAQKVRDKIEGVTELPYDAAHAIIKERRAEARRLEELHRHRREERAELMTLLGRD